MLLGDLIFLEVSAQPLAADAGSGGAHIKNIWLYRKSKYKECGSGFQPRFARSC